MECNDKIKLKMTPESSQEEVGTEIVKRILF